jgi:geranylgeranyl reductase family protein
MTTAASTETRQRPLEDLDRGRFDVIVVGAGPAGAITAGHLARLGHDVLMVDRERFPRDKACGDCLLFDAIDALDRAELLDDVSAAGRRLPRATIYSPSRYHFDVPGRFLTLRRKILDNIIAQGAVRAGVTFAEGDIRDMSTGKNGDITLTAFGTEAKVTGRIIAVATGAQMTFPTRTGMVTRQDPSAVAVRRYVKSDYMLDHMILSYDRSLVPGYAWIIPVGEGVYNVGAGTFYHDEHRSYGKLKKDLDRFLEEFPEGRELMARSSKTSRLTGAALRCGLTGVHPVVHSRVLAVGETIGATFPFTGEGIGKAMETGEIAAGIIDEALRADDAGLLRDYGRRINEYLGPRYTGYFFAERWLSHPWLNDFMAWRIQHSKYLQARFKEFVSETGDPRKVYALWSIVRSFWQ